LILIKDELSLDRRQTAINIFKLPNLMQEEEIFEKLIPDTGVLIERIVSTGQTTYPGVWYDQERDEWVVLLQGNARLIWENGKALNMESGDWVLIPAHERHRIDYTSSQPPCIWLAIHAKLQ
jgi:cupin 2 domain-containing protein